MISPATGFIAGTLPPSLFSASILFSSLTVSPPSASPNREPFAVRGLTTASVPPCTARQNKPQPDYRILKLRDYEDHLKSMQDIVKNNRVRNEYAVWENKTDGKIKRNRIMQRY